MTSTPYFPQRSRSGRKLTLGTLARAVGVEHARALDAASVAATPRQGLEEARAMYVGKRKRPA
jgi:hypothetical protein